MAVVKSHIRHGVTARLEGTIKKAPEISPGLFNLYSLKAKVINYYFLSLSSTSSYSTSDTSSAAFPPV